MSVPPTHYFLSGTIEYYVRQLPLFFPHLCELIELPYLTREGRQCLAVQVGLRRWQTDGAILVTGNVHARELGGSEFCVYLAYDLCQAYSQGTGLEYGGKTFTNAQVRTIIQRLRLIVFPCVNPDGRDWSLIGALEGDAEKALWRGNRNFPEGCYGVDLNRNQDFLWHYERHFRPLASVQTSSDPCDSRQLYRGPAPTSEPEAQNVAWLLERYASIYCYLDIHSHNGAIVHPWGDDALQTDNPDMNFRNAAYDGLRDANTSDYSEYMPAEDLATFERLGRAFQTSVQAVRDETYQLMPSVQLAPIAFSWGGIEYASTSGANDDYAYSRHFSDPSKTKVYALTVEFGRNSSWAARSGRFSRHFRRWRGSSRT
jgi:murein tripeptide amidase MpaA